MKNKTKKQSKHTKYIFVTGGVVSGLGKGITAASLGKILSSRGFLVNMQKCDPYLNTDAGTLNPSEHGEVFVTHDGAETDLDLGHYERFIDRELDRSSSVISGQIFSSVIDNERKGKYLGKTVQIIPHVTDEIQRRIIDAGKGFDIHIVEIGGTVGDYEAMAFIEAVRQMKHKVGHDNVLYAHLVFLPYLEASKELKTKPAQNSVRDLREAGVVPDVLFVRTDHPINADALNKMSLYCDVEKDAIVALQTAKSVYGVPITMEDSGIAKYILNHFKLKPTKADLNDWSNLLNTIDSVKKEITIGVIAKYMAHEDTYMSVFEAIRAAGWKNNIGINIKWIDAENIDFLQKDLSGVDGIIVPGGFGDRGVEGKILAAKYARENKLPYLGLCLGMQVAVIEFARHVLNINDANSTEFDKNTTNPVIHIMPSQLGVQMGGSMRLGDYKCTISKNSRAHLAYQKTHILERHRHRYEFNNKYKDILSSNGMVFSGINPDSNLVEIIEYIDHPFFVASQFHPEFKSRPDHAHPLFTDFVEAVYKNSQHVLAKSSNKLENKVSY
jgi:CTP synthase